MSAGGFARLLESLHPDPGRAAEEYERLRRALVRFFDWRGISAPDESADEVLDRLGHKLEDTSVQDVRKYAHGIARLVALERRRGPSFSSLDDMPRLPLVAPVTVHDRDEDLHDCFDRCLGELPEEGRALLLGYYEGERQAKISEPPAARVDLRPDGQRAPQPRATAARPARAVRALLLATCGSPGMTTVAETERARRYLLGQATDDESAALEQQYFESQDALDRIAAAEDDLIEDYLANQLDRADRERFERSYLATPEHRIRVETIRRLTARASQSPSTRRESAPATRPGYFARHSTWLALAASVIVLASVGLWLLLAANRNPPAVVENRPAEPAATSASGGTDSRTATDSCADPFTAHGARQRGPAGNDHPCRHGRRCHSPRKRRGQQKGIRPASGDSNGRGAGSVAGACHRRDQSAPRRRRATRRARGARARQRLHRRPVQDGSKGS